MVATPPSRTVALEWCRSNAPDLRIQHAESASAARFTYRGRSFELQVEGEGHADAIVRRVFEAIRAEQGDPVPMTDNVSEARALEPQIIDARMRGAHGEADALEAELLRLRAGGTPKPLRPRVRHEGVITPNTGPKAKWQQW